MSKLKEYERDLTNPLKQATILLLIRDDEVLLAMKKRDFGVGKWNGVGGKPRQGENITAAAIREAEEEIGVRVSDIVQLGILNFYHLGHENWNQQVIVYKANYWDGQPSETEEMRPKWFKFCEVPYIDMWPDDVLWLPKVLAGSFVKASFLLDENQNLLDHYFLLQ